MVVVASSGKFKTTSVVVPNLLAGGANKIVLDVKGELMRNYGIISERKRIYDKMS